MSIFNVKKDGSGTHTQIQAAIYDAVNGDVINIGPGTWNENIDLYKSVQLIGAGKDQTFIQGQFAAQTFAGASFFSGEDTATIASTAGMVKGRTISGTGITAGTRIAEIISETQFRFSAVATVATDPTVVSKTAAAVVSGNATITLPNVTSLAVGMKAEGTGVNGYITAINATAKTVTLDAAPSQSGSSIVISFKLAANITAGSSTIVLPSVTGIAAGQKIIGTGVQSVINSVNSTTKTITLATPVSATGTKVVFSFRLARSNTTITMASQFSGSSIPATVQLMNVATNGVAIKNLTVIGFDNTSPAVECAAIGLNNPGSGTHQNWMIDGCRITANGDSALLTGSNFNSQDGTVQNCIFDGQTFSGLEPAEVPGFSTNTLNVTVVAVTAANFTVEFASSALTPTAGGSSFSSTAYAGTAIFSSSNPSLKQAVLTKASSGLTVGQVIPLTFNMQTNIPNVARQMVVIGNSSTVTNCINTTFKNNTVNGKTGAVISATGNHAMFNAAVTVDTVGGLIEGNTIDGNFGAGGTNTLMSNSAIRSRRPDGAAYETIIRNNTNVTTNGRGNSGFYFSGSPVTQSNNIEVNTPLVSSTQSASGQPVEVEMSQSVLLNISKVSSSPTFSNVANWHLVSYVFKKQNSSQRLVASFRDFEAIKSMKLKSGMNSGDSFQLHKIIIADSNRNLIVMKRSEIDLASSFDFTLA